MHRRGVGVRPPGHGNRRLHACCRPIETAAFAAALACRKSSCANGWSLAVPIQS